MRGPGGGGDELTPVANSLSLRFQMSRCEHIRLEREGGKGGRGKGKEGGCPSGIFSLQVSENYF